MLDPLQLLASLQHADSFFPAGGIAFSWGIESLVNDAQIRSVDDLDACLSAQLALRWNNFDRPFLVAAYQSVQDRGALIALDLELDAMVLAREAREGSRRAGASLLLVHEKLGTPGAQSYRFGVNEGAAPGHLAIAQAVVWHGVGLEQAAVESISAYAFCVGMAGAALRLGVLGHLAAQQIMTRMRPVIGTLLAVPAVDVARAQSFTPAAEIAMMRHEVQQSRLFAN